MDEKTLNHRRAEEACVQARQHLLRLLLALGLKSTVDEDQVRSEATKAGVTVQAYVVIRPNRLDWMSSKFDMEVKVQRVRRSITYKRSPESWETFPWAKITDTHVAEVRGALDKQIQYNTEYAEREAQIKLAQQEVPLPASGNRYREHSLLGFDRVRSKDGAYHVWMDAQGLTASEACAIRDTVVAAQQRSTANLAKD